MNRKAELVALLRAEIAGGRWEPGGRLPAERDLALTYGVSRPVAREGLRELAALGLVEVRRGSGAYVASVNPIELAEVRLVVEPLAARLAAERHRAEHAELLRATLTDLRAAVTDLKAFATADLALHAAIVSAADNSVLERTHDQLAALLTLSRGVTVHDTGRLERSLEEHEQLVAAVLTRDAKAAEAAMRRHIQSIARSAQALVRDEIAAGGGGRSTTNQEDNSR